MKNYVVLKRKINLERYSKMFWYMMRKSLFLLFIVLFNSIGLCKAQDITLSLKDVTLESAFKQIKEMTHVDFFYSNDQLDVTKVVNGHFENEQIETVVQTLVGREYNVTLVDDKLLLITAEEDLPLRGSVTDADTGDPITGASVKVKGTTIGAITDINGEFYIQDVPTGTQTIIISHVGYGVKEIAYTGQTSIDVGLSISDKELNKVVVVGYGTKKRSEVTAAISSVNVDAAKSYLASNASFDRGLAGLAKGLLVLERSGRPGGGVDINIRGVTSPFSGADNEPLFVIDGVPFQTNPTQDVGGTGNAVGVNALLSINPDNIESIDVLKDAAATAIYGSRGVNGVIIVKTKRGEKNQKPKVTINSDITISEPIGRIKYMNTAQYKETAEDLLRNSVDAANNGSFSVFSVFNRFNDIADISLDPSTFKLSFNGLVDAGFGTMDTDWADLVYKNNPFAHRNNITISGGSESTNYSFGFGHISKEGLVRNDILNNSNLQFAIDSRVNNAITVGLNANLGYLNNKSGGGIYTGSLNKNLNARPDLEPFDEDGNFALLPGWGGFLSANPLADITGADVVNKSLSALGSAYAEIKPIKNVTLRSDVTLGRFNTDGRDFTPIGSQGYRPPLDTRLAALTNSSVINTNLGANHLLTYANNFGKHNVSAMAGLTFERFYTDREVSFYAGFPDDKVLVLAQNAENVTGTGSSKTESGLNSALGRVSYNYDSKYFLTAALRRDRSSKFGPQNQNALFPSISGSWTITNEDFFKEESFVNYLNLRAGYGQTGSNNLRDFLFLQFFASGDRPATALYNGQAAVGLNGTLPNLEIGWEETREHNVGLDFKFFENRLTGNIDVYNRKTTGALLPAFFPLETGALSYTANFADITNKGVELSLGGDIVRSEDFTWSAMLNISRNRNILNDFILTEANDFFADSYEIGKEINLIKGYIVDGIFRDQAEVDEYNNKADDGIYQYRGTGPGDYRYRDINGDGKITLKGDQVNLGSSQADFFGGFNSTFTYKRFRLSPLFTFSKGAEAQWEPFNSFNQLLNPYKNYDARLYNNIWTPDNLDARYAKSAVSDPNFNYTLRSDRVVHDASYIRLKTLALSYNMPTEVLKNIGLDNMSLSLSGFNLWTGTKFPGIDPEALSGGFASPGGSTTNNDPYPLAKSWSLGMRVQF